LQSKSLQSKSLKDWKDLRIQGCPAFQAHVNVDCVTSKNFRQRERIARPFLSPYCQGSCHTQTCWVPSYTRCLFRTARETQSELDCFLSEAPSASPHAFTKV
jgi:hypothetical protein